MRISYLLYELIKQFDMTFLIIETFHPGKVKQVYERFDQQGRMLPNGVQYIDSWVDEKVERCFQLMESESLDLLNEWISKWDDLVDFEVVPLISSAQAKKIVIGK